MLLEEKKVIGLSWEPKLPTLLFASSKGQSQNIGSSSQTITSLSTSELIDGLFVPPNDPKTVNKLLKKQVKDTAGKGW